MQNFSKLILQNRRFLPEVVPAYDKAVSPLCLAGAIGKIIFVSVSLKCPIRARGAVRIARQPSKLKVMGSNPIGPAIVLKLIRVD